MGLLIALFANPLIGLFTKSDTQMLQIGALAIRLQCIALPIHAWVAIVNMLCVAVGKAKEALILSTARQGSCFLPIVHLMAKLGGAYGIAAVQAVADVLTLILAFPIRNKLLKLIDETEHKAKIAEFT